MNEPVTASEAAEIFFGEDSPLKRVYGSGFEARPAQRELAEAYAEAGADLICVHQEACVHLHRVIQQIKALGIKAGAAINPGTPVSMLEPVLGDLDMVLVMSVNPGFAGQPLIPACLKKVSDLKQMLEDHGRGDILIEMDGHVSPETAPKMLEAGATILVGGTGSVFAKGRSLKENIRIMKKIVE